MRRREICKHAWGPKACISPPTTVRRPPVTGASVAHTTAGRTPHFQNHKVGLQPIRTFYYLGISAVLCPPSPWRTRREWTGVPPPRLLSNQYTSMDCTVSFLLCGQFVYTAHTNRRMEWGRVRKPRPGNSNERCGCLSQIRDRFPPSDHSMFLYVLDINLFIYRRGCIL